MSQPDIDSESNSPVIGEPTRAQPIPPLARLTHVVVRPATLEGYDWQIGKKLSRSLPSGTKVQVGYSHGANTHVVTEHGDVGEIPTSQLREVWRVESPPEAIAVAQANNLLACDLYRELRGSEGNLFFSPLSIHAALAMTWAGATAKNEAEMANTLHVTPPQQRVHAAYGHLQRSLAHDEKVSGFSLSVANRLWGKAGYQFVPQFVAATREHYGAEIQSVDFSKPTEAAATINAWVQQQTRDKIRDLVSPEHIDPIYTRLILTNAVYFKADWSEPFDRDSTKAGPFQLLSGNAVEVPLMHKTDSFRWRTGDGFKLLEMPYGQGQLSMLILLPDANDGLAALEATQTEANLRCWHDELKPASVQVVLPRFRLESKFSLRETLGRLGMTRAFEEHVDNFLGLTTEPPQWLSDVLHQAYVDVNEQGTEAAAATAMVMAAGGVPPPPPTFIADHPFLFLIRDNQSGAILFLGRVVDPRG